MSNVTALKIEPEFCSQLQKIKIEIENASAEITLEAVPKLIDARGKNAFELGGRLAKIKDDVLWPGADGKMSFSDWMETQGIKHSRGYALIDIYKVIMECDLSPDILDTVRWSKLILIAPRFKFGTSKAVKSNAAWIEKAENSSQLELRAELKAAKGGKSAPDCAGQHSFKFYPDIEKTFQAAMTRAKKETDTNTDVEAMDSIFSGYLAGKTKTVTIKSMMKKSGPVAVLKTFGELWPDIDIKMPF
jgi:hypothetical protein